MNSKKIKAKSNLSNTWLRSLYNLAIVYKKVWKTSKLYIILNSFMVILNAIKPFNSVIFLSLIIQELTENRDWQAAVLYAIIFCSIEVVVRCISLLFTNYENYAIEKIKTRFLFEIEEKTIDMPYQVVDSPHFMDKLEKSMEVFFPCQAHFMDIRNSIVCGSQLISYIIQLIGCISILFTLNFLVLLSILVICLISMVLHSIASNKEFQLWDQSLVAIGRQIGYYQEVSIDFAYAKEMRINQLGQWVVNKMKYVMQSLVGGIEKTTITFTSTSSISKILMILLDGVIYIYLGFLVLNNVLNLAQLNAYISSIATMIASLLGISACFITIKQSGIYIQNYLDYINMEMISNGRLLYPDTSENFVLELQDVWFRYPGQEEYVLKGISLTISKNSKFAIVGDNGAGKTTLIKLIMRLYSPSKGRILLNNVDINEIPLDDYMKHIATVDQDFKILNYSLAENIRFDQEMSEEQLNTIIQEISLDSMVENLPKGSDTILGKLFDQDGIELSAGQQQKVAIARALGKKADLIILDEPTAMLSPIMENEIYMNFSHLTQNRTAIYISHRMSSCQFCDNIVVIDHGKVIECGSHDFLMQQEGMYHKLYTLQADLYKNM